MNEEVMTFGSAGSLVGILTHPPDDKAARPMAMIFLNAGLVHRVGPNRLYVKAARRLAARGFPAFRFDFSGIGDSPVRYDDLPFDARRMGEIREAMSFLSAATGVERFCLLGICSGAVAAFQAACSDPRVDGVVSINPQGPAGEELSSYVLRKSEARYYWKTAFFHPKSWWKALTGRADYLEILKTIGFQLRSFTRQRERPASPGDPGPELRRLGERNVRILRVYSEGDAGLDYFRLAFGDVTRELLSRGSLQLEIVPRTDHTFTSLRSQEHLLKTITDWTETLRCDLPAAPGVRPERSAG